ncbi:MAG: hypothetical protein IT183_04225 [Acidobacteria bacterium]|nr:hypothetical protein [Acidobacteriota bacterium]
MVVAVLGLGLVAATRASASPADETMAALQRAVDSLRARLGITHEVTVSVVTSDARVFSMTPPPAAGEPFKVEIDATFLATLVDDEVTAALARELGHVWVATNRPFLQTERLANDVAMRVVTRSSLARVYRKMSAYTGMATDEKAYLGPELLKVTRRTVPD